MYCFFIIFQKAQYKPNTSPILTDRILQANLKSKIMVQTTQTVYQLNADDLKQCIQEIVDENIARYFSKPKEEKFLTIKQVAELLGVTEPTLWRWNKEGVLKRVKVGNKVRYKESDVNKVLEEMA